MILATVPKCCGFTAKSSLAEHRPCSRQTPRTRLEMAPNQPSGDMHLALLINDEEWTTRSIESILKPEGYAVLMAYTGRQGFELASRVDADVLLLDLQLPDITGIELCAR